MGKEPKTETIFALASGRGRAGIAVIRISGPKAGEALKSITKAPLPRPRRACRASLWSKKNAELVDTGLVFWFPGPKSFTGEDIAELQVHGSLAVIEKISSELIALGLRLAEPGEFSRRAFEHGKLDLTQAEGLNDLVLAETEAQRKQALGQLGGGLSKIYQAWRAQLLDLQADIEATIDFSDEEIPPGLLERVAAGVKTLKADLEGALETFGRGQAIRRGYRIVLLGAPNVGKSSLLNRLAREERAIVSEVAGTTRDTIEVHLNLGGFSVVLVDTAGLREAGDAIEQEGIRRTLLQAGEADLKLLLSEAAGWPNLPPKLEGHLGERAIIVLTKADLETSTPFQPKEKSGVRAISVSAKTGEGLDDLIKVLEAKTVAALEASEPAGLTRLRHKEAISDALEALDRFLAHDLEGTDPALLAEDLRLAARTLQGLTGAVGVEEILGKIFSQFCIGK